MLVKSASPVTSMAWAHLAFDQPIPQIVKEKTQGLRLESAMDQSQIESFWGLK